MKIKLIAAGGLLAFVIIVLSSFSICAGIICRANPEMLGAAYILGIAILLIGVTIACHILTIASRYWYRHGRH